MFLNIMLTREISFIFHVKSPHVKQSFFDFLLSSIGKMSEKQFWGKKIFCLITGASRGLGRAVALGIAEKLQNSKALFLLIARDGKKLEDVKSLTSNANISVHTASRDLSKPSVEDFVEIIKSALLHDKVEDFDQLLLIHNAGSIGDITKEARDFKDLSELQSYLDLNLNSVMLLTSAFLDVFKGSNGRIGIINISSLMATEAFKGFTLYCTGKAARLMYFRVLALENTNIRVLNYSPGPLETDMVNEILNHGPSESREMFKGMRKEGKILKCETTVQKLIGILEKDEYKSGISIDFFDRI